MEVKIEGRNEDRGKDVMKDRGKEGMKIEGEKE
jgi:hypothetical protein